MKRLIKSYICPSCEEKQTSAIEWQSKRIGDKLDFKTGEWKMNVEESDADFDCWTCPNCGDTLSEKIVDKIWELLDR